ncbi:MAG: DinB family protein [Acidobacteria bacterium]|nr:DinB family protein [Acidobacteriota bacterium]
MIREGLIAQVETMHRFFRNSIRRLEERDSAYAPFKEMYSVAEQVAHTAMTVQWFMDGAFGPSGFDMNFEEHAEAIRRYVSLEQAVEFLDRAVVEAVEILSTRTDEELLAPLPEGPVLGGMPRMAVISAMVDHTAHHRGALTVYARLLGKVPPMPYGQD